MHHEVVSAKTKQIHGVFTPLPQQVALCCSLLRLVSHFDSYRFKSLRAKQDNLRWIFGNRQDRPSSSFHAVLRAALCATMNCAIPPILGYVSPLVSSNQLIFGNALGCIWPMGRDLENGPTIKHHYSTNSTITVPFFSPAASIDSCRESMRFLPMDTNSKSIPSLPSKGSAFRNS